MNPANGAPIAYTAINPTSEKRIVGKYETILGYALILTLPLLILAAALVGLVFHYRVQHNDVSNVLRSAATVDEPGVFYVNINSTYLMKVASLASTVATSLAAFAVVLAAFPLASSLLRHTQNGSPENLLTPYQYYLGVNLVEGAGYISVYKWLKYQFGHSKRNVAQPGPMVNLAATVIVTMLLG